MNRVWDDTTAHELEIFVAAGVSTQDMADHFEVSPKQVRSWKRKLRKRHARGFEKKPDAFLADSDAFLMGLEQRMIQGLENGGLTPAQVVLYTKNAAAFREGRVRLRQAAGIITPKTEQELGVDEMTDDQVNRELTELNSKISRLDPERVRTKKKAGGAK